MSQHHFIVQFDSDTGEFTWDTEVEENLFKYGAIYLPEVDEWTKPNTNSTDEAIRKASIIDNTVTNLIGNLTTLLNTVYSTSGKGNSNGI